MKLSILVAAACAAIALASAAYAQTSQTYHFGEGQAGMSSGAQTAPARHAAKTPAHRHRKHRAHRAVRSPRTYTHH
ncbi:hypothetical protein [Burkholderia pseudomallei]|uniref:hypothetical protein n=1 Tax=Burkholderia pseudomallei TaxID=28450 RepID=UPI0003D9645C|nr:hypothetical protein [Burkholderia pseudomallei]AHE28411.1 hypothetical protein BBJ_967 [Burkholderia pseudomallei NCTC 13178]